MPLSVAIVGRPNVGKSTLFNRLAGRKTALVAGEAGLTRDRREVAVDFAGLALRLTDTAGVETTTRSDMAARLRLQTEKALAAADVALFVIDAREGVTALDRDVARWLRRQGKPVILVANKTEGRAPPGLAEAFELGLGTPVPVSAEHGEGISALYDALLPFARSESGDAPAPEPAKRAAALQLAVVGRPNVGKSTLVNRLLGEERVLTGPEPGVTRDAIAIEWQWRGQPIKLIDTAGLRRKAKAVKGAETLAVGDTLKTVRFAEVVVLVIDATAGVQRQDLAIARLVADEGRAIVLAANKWDLVAAPKEALTDIVERISESLPQLAGLKPLTLSAATGAGLAKLLPAALKAHIAWNHRVPTGALNRLLARALERHPLPLVGGRRLKLRYMTQVNTRPPTFALFASKPGELPDSWRRYLANLLREQFDLPGVPLRLMLRKGQNPFAKNS
ncbi:MAG TPA: ribosome biogenesis GTPase Der [Stellaceae bacterium]|nr:ribosome biogenesis GTPase Der [Stellaceae bacterium]HEV2263987.1 ribosome biogenesis GTPase Der [Stellaceae bacterium]